MSILYPLALNIYNVFLFYILILYLPTANI